MGAASLPSAEASSTLRAAIGAASLQSAEAAVPLPFEPYRWAPIMVRQHTEETEPGYVGTYVSTLSTSIDAACAEWRPLEMACDGFHAIGEVACCRVGEGLVLCRGHVLGTCPQEHDPGGSRHGRIGRLPEQLRPQQPLQFAAQCEASRWRARCRTGVAHLVTLVVTPDGWIQGFGAHEVEAVVDLSAIRFSVGPGLLITDEVRLCTFDLGANRRLAMLQGSLHRRLFKNEEKKSLAILPQSCKPPGRLSFIVSGSRAGGFHLVSVSPAAGHSVGGELHWDDGVWPHDELHLTGIIFEVAGEALQHALQTWTSARKGIVVSDFQRLLRRKYGSLGDAWQKAFDLSQAGQINFTEFGQGCKASGFCGNVSRLWSMLDEDGSGEISFDELECDVGGGS